MTQTSLKRLSLATVAFLVHATAIRAQSGSTPYQFSPEGEKSVILKAQAFSDREEIAPGEVFNILISLRIQEDWHIYWSNVGGSTGKPTTIDWKLPEGFEVGPTRFSAPKTYFDKQLEETYWVLEDQAAMITSIKPPAELKPGESVKIEAIVSWLACNESCIPGQTNPALSLTLPVVAPGSPEKPANEELFEKAGRSLPTPGEKAKHLRINGKLDPPTAKPGQKATAILEVDIAEKMHMQSNKPNQDYLIPAVVFVDSTTGLTFGQVEYPTPHQRSDKMMGTLSEFTGKVEFRIPVEVDEDISQDGRWIRGVFRHQLCEDSGTCLAPQNVTFAIPVQIEGGPVPSAEAEWTVPATTAEDSETADAAQKPIVKTNGGDEKNLLLRLQEWLLNFGYIGALAAAFVGGLILNLMPCVLPVLSLKILSFVRQAHEDRRRIFLLGLVYCAGIMTFFGVLAGLFAWTGTGWGQLFQSPTFVIIVAGVVTAFAMSLFGVFTVFTPRVVSSLDEKVQGEGFTSAYATGLLATLLGTACTAPFLSAAIGAATKVTITHGPVYAGMIFLAAGFGMAMPFLVLAANPALMKFVPKPGPWMKTFEAMMGFVLLITVIWLMNPLRGQIGDFGVLLALFFLLMVSMAVWVRGKVQYGDPLPRKASLYSLAVILIAIGWVLPFRVFASVDSLIEEKIRVNNLMSYGRYYLQNKPAFDDCGCVNDPYCHVWDNVDDGEIPWQDYEKDRVLDAVRGGHSVFVDYTADWCGTCKGNLIFIGSDESVKTMRELRVIPFEADFSLMDKPLADDLKKYGRAGVPMYLFYSPGDPDNPQVLDALTTGVMVDALRRAGPSRAPECEKALARN